MSPDKKKTLSLSAAAILFLSASSLSAYAFGTPMGHPFNTYCLYFALTLAAVSILFLVIALSIKDNK